MKLVMEDNFFDIGCMLLHALRSYQRVSNSRLLILIRPLIIVTLLCITNVDNTMRERKSRHVLALCKKFAYGVMLTSTSTALRLVLIVVMMNIW